MFSGFRVEVIAVDTDSKTAERPQFPDAVSQCFIPFLEGEDRSIVSRGLGSGKGRGIMLSPPLFMGLGSDWRPCFRVLDWGDRSRSC